jgi:hypothetical protein
MLCEGRSLSQYREACSEGQRSVHILAGISRVATAALLEPPPAGKFAGRRLPRLLPVYAVD